METQVIETALVVDSTQVLDHNECENKQNGNHETKVKKI